MEKTEAKRESMNRMAAMFVIAFGASLSYLLVISLLGWHTHMRQHPLWLFAFSFSIAALVFTLATYSEKYRKLAIGSGPVKVLWKWLVTFILITAGFIVVGLWVQDNGFLNVIAIASESVGIVAYALVHRRAAA